MEPELHGPQRHSGSSRQRAPQAALWGPGVYGWGWSLQGKQEVARLDSMHPCGSLTEGHNWNWQESLCCEDSEIVFQAGSAAGGAKDYRVRSAWPWRAERKFCLPCQWKPSTHRDGLRFEIEPSSVLNRTWDWLARGIQRSPSSLDLSGFRKKMCILKSDHVSAVAQLLSPVTASGVKS